MRVSRFLILLSIVIATAMIGGNTRVLAQDPPPPPIDIFVEEDIGVSDSEDTVPPTVIDVDESVSVDDDVTLVGPVVIEVSENIAVSDDASVTGPVVIEVDETILVSDSAVASGPVVINVSEQIVVTDSGGLVNSTPLVDAGPSLTIDEGSPATLAASVIVLDPQLTTATIDWGDGSLADQVIPTMAGAISATHLYADEGIFSVTVTVAGLFGDQGTNLTQIEVVNVAPLADAGGPYGGNTDEAIVLTAIGDDPGDDPITYAWDLNGDGVFDEGSSQSVIFSSSTPGIFPVSIEIQDDAGESTIGISQVVISAVVVPAGDSNADPTLEIPGFTSPSSGSTLSISETFQWSRNDTSVLFWVLRLGTSPGADDLYSSGVLGPEVLSATANLSGSVIHATLFYLDEACGWEQIAETYTGPGVVDPPRGILEPLAPSNPSVLLNSTNGTVPRPHQAGDQIILNATIQPGSGGFTRPVNHLEFTLDGLPLPPPAFEVAISSDLYRAFLGIDVAVPGAVLEFAATAFDAAGVELASATLTLTIESAEPPLILTIMNHSPVVHTDGIAQYSAFTQNTSGRPVDYTWLMDGSEVAAGTSLLVLNSALLPVLPEPRFEITVEAVDWLGRTATATTITNVLPVETPDADTDSNEPDEPVDNGKVLGRSVIGQLVQLSKEWIVVNAKVGNDFSDVKIHMDSDATEMSPALDAESYTTGSKVVVIADSDVLSGDATALKIAPIPGTAIRKHDRVLVSKPTNGNAANLVDPDDGGSNSVVKDELGDLDDGDQVVILVRREDSNERNEKPKVIDNNDVKNRLDEYAHSKFNDGDTDSTGLIDKLAKERLEKEQQRIDEAKKHGDEVIRRAAELADEKAKRAAENDAADPIKAVRTQAIADSEAEIVECASRVVGRTISGEGDLTDEEKRRVIAACIGEGDDEHRIPDGDESGSRTEPPAEVLECIIRVMGSVPNRALTDDEEARLKSACASDDNNENDEDKSKEEVNDERHSDEAVDARKVAFCEANPADSHCTGDSAGSSGDKDGEVTSGSKGDDISEDEKIAFCAANPGDPRCASGDGDLDGKDESGTKDGEDGKDESDSKDDSSGGSKDDSGSKQPGK